MIRVSGAAMSMNKLGSKYAQIYVLIAAFLAMQWTTTHAHLNDHQQNEDIQHQHQIEAHTHNLVVQHTKIIELSHSADHEHTAHESIIEFDCKASLPNREKQKSNLFLFADLTFQLRRSIALTRVTIAFDRTGRPDRLYRSQRNPRAPPQAS